MRRAEENGALAAALAAEERAIAAGMRPDAPRNVTAAAVVTQEVEQTTDADGGVTLRVKNLPRVKTVDEVIAAAGLDPAHWTVKSATLKAYEGFMKSPTGDPIVVPLTSATVQLAPNRGAVAAIAAIAALIEDAKAHAPIYPQVRFIKPQAADRHMAIVSITDHHFGLLAWADESGESYDVGIAERLASEAMTAILSRLQPYPLERIMLSLGSDWFHSDKTVDGKGGSTTRGTVQETDGRWQRTWRAGVRAAVGLIDQASAVAPVTALFRSGNHDEQTAFFLGDLIDAWYRNNAAVKVANIPAPRCYERYGESLIGFAHGHNEKPSSLPMLMATERPADWAATRFHDWMTGHLHRKGILMDEVGGVQMYTMPSLCGRDAWHAAKGYAHRRSCETRIYHHDDGPIAHLTFNAKAVA